MLSLSLIMQSVNFLPLYVEGHWNMKVFVCFLFNERHNAFLIYYILIIKPVNIKGWKRVSQTWVYRISHSNFRWSKINTVESEVWIVDVESEGKKKKKQRLWCCNFKKAHGKSPVNIKGSSWRIRALSEGLWSNVTYVSSSCQILHEQCLAHVLFPVD